MRVVENGTRFLMTFEKPCEGKTCSGKETFANGYTKNVNTTVVRNITELLSGKYYMETTDAYYLVDVCDL